MVYLGDLSYESIKKRLLNIKDKDKQLCLTLIFVTASRVGEIVRYHKDKLKTPEHLMINSPLRDDDIYIETLASGKKRVVIRVKKLKIKKKSKGKVSPFRLVYLNYSKEKELLTIVLDAWKAKKKQGGGFFVNISTRTAENWFKEFFPEFGCNIHHFRHWRISCYKSGAVTGKRVPAEEISKIVGHSNLLTTRIYDHVDAKDYAEEL